MEKLFLVACTLLGAIITQAQTGIGTTTPLARLHVTDSSVLFSATGDVPFTPGNPPVQGVGRRMMWYPDKGAFRAGYATGTEWDATNTGKYSVAMGYGTTAKGLFSFATGQFTTASAQGSVAMGNNNIASATACVAMGAGCTASLDNSVAMGSGNIASGFNSTALGFNTNASAGQTTAMGDHTVASGSESTAMGTYVSTNSKAGAFIIGDNSSGTTVTNSSLANQMTTRFANGYIFYTNSAATVGATLTAGSGSWTNVSDRRKKENFRVLNTEEVLKKIAAIPVTNWNYKSQDKSVRHIGPMAQDFYAAFGLDGVGADTTINTTDIDGVNMAAIQALEKRTVALQAENTKLKATVTELLQQSTLLSRRLEALEHKTAAAAIKVALTAAK